MRATLASVASVGRPSELGEGLDSVFFRLGASVAKGLGIRKRATVHSHSALGIP